MSTLIDPTIIFVIEHIVIYVGIPILIIGIFGGILNIIVFLSLKTFRQNSCAFFLTIMSFVNIGQLLTSLFTRIMISGFGIDWTATSIGFCKFRNYCLQVCALTSYTCMCLATIDQFLATSLHLRWQQFLNIKKAYFLCLLFFIIWLLHGIPTLIWYNWISIMGIGETICIITNSIFQKYNSYCYLLILTGILPIFITVTFGSLAYHNVRQIPYRIVPLVRRELDKQLTSMVLVQVVFNLFVIVPFIVVLILVYTPQFISQAGNTLSFAVVNTIFGINYYLYFASPFYIYIFVSKRFRQQLVHVFADIYLKSWKHEVIANNQVSPEGNELKDNDTA